MPVQLFSSQHSPFLTDHHSLWCTQQPLCSCYLFHKGWVAFDHSHIGDFDLRRAIVGGFQVAAQIDTEFFTASSYVNATLAKDYFVSVNPLMCITDNEEIVWSITTRNELA